MIVSVSGLSSKASVTTSRQILREHGAVHIRPSEWENLQADKLSNIVLKPLDSNGSHDLRYSIPNGF
jgi:hypothetical protein